MNRPLTIIQIVFLGKALCLPSLACSDNGTDVRGKSEGKANPIVIEHAGDKLPADSWAAQAVVPCDPGFYYVPELMTCVPNGPGGRF